MHPNILKGTYPFLMNFDLWVHVDAPKSFLMNFIDFFIILFLWMHVDALDACCGCIGCIWMHVDACGCILAVAQNTPLISSLENCFRKLKMPHYEIQRL